MDWVHPAGATFPQNCTLILDMYPVVSENETFPPAISPAGITFRFHQKAPKYRSSRAKHTTTTDLPPNCCNPSCTSTLPALNIQGRWQATAKPAQSRTLLSCCRDHKKHTRTHTTQRRHGRGGQRGESCGGGLVRACCCAYRQRSTVPYSRGCENCLPFCIFHPPAFELFSLDLLATPRNVHTTKQR